MQLGLFIIGILFRKKKDFDTIGGIGVSASEGGATLLFGAVGMFHLYFSSERF